MASSPGNPTPTSPTLTSRLPILDSYAAYGAVTLALLYVIGFTVVNSELEAFEVLEFQLVKSRYFAAALLFLSVTSYPIALALYWAQSIRHLFSKCEARYHHTKTLFRMIFITVLAIFAWTAFMQTLVVSRAPLLKLLPPMEAIALTSYEVRIPALYCMITAVLSLLLAPLWAGMTKLTRKEYDIPDRNAMKLLIVALTLGAAVLSAWYFGRTAFPYIRPGFGGGAGWVVETYATQDSLPVPIRTFMSAETVMLDRDEHYARLLRCRPAATDAEPFFTLEVPRPVIAGLSVKRLIAISEFAKLCVEGASRRIRRAAPDNTPRSN